VWVDHPLIALRANITGRNHEALTHEPRKRLFCDHTPEAIIESCVARCEPESIRASFIDAGFRLPKPKRIFTPLLVLGGEDDGLVSNGEVRATARAYRTQAELFPKMGHNMMLEPGWQAAAKRIDAWLTAQGL